MGLWDGVKFLVREAITYKTVKVRRRPREIPRLSSRENEILLLSSPSPTTFMSPRP